ncbi:MAG: ubiquinone/menaquinone biosynthesis C-methylase UbiE [Crocinitomicaceae bacterium]|jgi:ubiquinone/menaquinone biosynthesis C-methylase UbiE
MNTFSDPRKIVEQLNFLPGQQIADIGSGSGAYTLAIAEKINNNSESESRIFAVDIQQDLLNRLAQEANERNLTSVHIIWGDIEEGKGTRIRHESLDTVLLVNTLFQLEHRSQACVEAARIIKPGGRIIIIDWSDSFGNIGPKSDHIVSMDTSKLLVEEAGLVFDTSFDAGEHHYGFIAIKK